MLVGTSRDWANVVRDRRTELGLTQEQLAERVGRARQWIVRFEAGAAGSASVDSLMKVLDALDLAVAIEDTGEDPAPMFMDVDALDADDGR